MNSITKKNVFNGFSKHCLDFNHTLNGKKFKKITQYTGRKSLEFLEQLHITKALNNPENTKQFFCNLFVGQNILT